MNLQEKMKALILAAGYATRLYPLTKEYPKPLLKIGERPIIEYIIEKLKTIKEINEIIVVTNSKFISIFKKWQATIQTTKRLSLVDDLTRSNADKRGAVGDIKFVIDKKRIKDDLLVIGGDNLFDGDLNEFVLFAKANKKHPAVGAYDIHDISKAEKYGVMKLNKLNKMIDFQEKSKTPKSTLVAMCLYYFPKGKLRLIKEYLNNKADLPRPSLKYSASFKEMRSKHDATGYYIDWLRKKEPIYAFIFAGRWYDIGHHEFYHEAKEVFVK